MSDWNLLSEPLQLRIAANAMYQATETLAAYAETIAGEMEEGGLSDHGGPEALRLFAAIVRTINGSEQTVIGHA